MTPPPEKKPKMNSSASPTFSTLGRSPSIGPPAYTTDDLVAARNQKHSRWVYLLRIGIAAITLGTSIAVIACAGVSLRGYTDSHLDGEWLLPLWPMNVDLRPTHTVLACGVVIAMLSVGYLAAAFAPMVELTLLGAADCDADAFRRGQTKCIHSTSYPRSSHSSPSPSPSSRPYSLP